MFAVGRVNRSVGPVDGNRWLTAGCDRRLTLGILYKASVVILKEREKNKTVYQLELDFV